MLVLAVRWDGLDVVAGAAGKPARLVAASRAQVELTFPPQSIAETKFAVPGDVSRRSARLAGSSRLTFELDGPTEIELSAVGLLGAIVGAGWQVDSADIELPWRLVSALDGRDVIVRHHAAPVLLRDVVGLWHTRLVGRDGSTLNAGLALVPLDPDLDSGDEDLDVGPLSRSERNMIRAAASVQKPRVRRLELSSLGGSLSAQQRTDDFAWDHEASLGRDEKVRVLMKGVLYPFGHRAEYEVLAERRFEPAGSPAVAGLVRKKVLTITEPVRSMANSGREFPFSEVEILRRSWTELGDDTFAEKPRPVLPTNDLVEEKARLRELRDRIEARLVETFNAQAQTPEAYIQRLREQVPEDDRVVDLDATEAAASVDPDELQRAREQDLRDLDRLTHLPHPGHPLPPAHPIGPTSTPEPPEPTPSPADEELARQIMEIRARLAGAESEENIARVRRERPGLQERARTLRAQLLAEFELTNTFPEFVEAHVGDNQDAVDYKELTRQITEIEDREAHIQSLAVPVGYAFIPRTPDNQHCVQFPLRCAGTEGDVVLSVPLVFVRDTHLPEDDHYPAYETLADDDVRTKVAHAWADAIRSDCRQVTFSATRAAGPPPPGIVSLPGVRIDLVRGGAPTPLPGDVHEVYALAVSASHTSDGFLPKLEHVEVELPAVRALLPEQARRIALTYTQAFLRGTEIPRVPLKVLDEANRIGLSFQKVADRSGGLVSPAFAVDAISRELGAVAAGALPPGLTDALPGDLPSFDLDSVYRDATLLGFPLTSLIKKAANGLPVSTPAPAIAQLFEGGVPNGVSMTWTLQLDQHGPFRPGDDSRLVLTATATRAERTTTCTVNNFRLVLPPDGVAEGLLTLKFDKVAFTQHDDQAPHLDIEGLSVGFGGALKLLQALQDELESFLHLPDNRPTVRASEKGVTATYSLSVPSIPAGAFLIRNITMRAGLDVPFDGAPVSVSLSFATRDNPFDVTILAFGGGGYIDLTLGPEGLRRLEASLDFLASLEVDFVVARGEVHAIAGVRFTEEAGSIAIDGFIRIGGSVEVLGLVSVAIELVVELEYEERDGQPTLVGSATLVLDVDVTLFSETVEIESGEWVLVGGGHSSPEDGTGPAVATAEEDRLGEWKRYRDAFAPDPA